MFEKELSLQGNIAFVTGAGRGLGRAIALGLAEAGADIVAVSRTAAEVEATASEATAMGRRALPLTADMTRSAEVDTTVARALREMGQLDILVNNVGGTQGLVKPVVETSDEEWEVVIGQNLNSTFFACRAVGRHFISRKTGRVINVASGAGLRGRENIASYCASKAAVINFSRALAAEMAQHGVRVNVLCPGWFRTSATAAALDNPARYDQITGSNLLKRVGSPEEVKVAAVFLASAASDYATGSVLSLDGGMAF